MNKFRSLQLKWFSILALVVSFHVSADEKPTVTEIYTKFFVSIFNDVKTELNRADPAQPWLLKAEPSFKGSDLSNKQAPKIHAAAILEVARTSWADENTELKFFLSGEGAPALGADKKPIILPKTNMEAADTTIKAGLKLSSLAKEPGKVPFTVKALNFAAEKFLDQGPCTPEQLKHEEPAEIEALKKTVCPAMEKIKTVVTLGEFYKEFKVVYDTVADLAKKNPRNPLKTVTGTYTLTTTNNVPQLKWGLTIGEADLGNDTNVTSASMGLDLTNTTAELRMEAKLRHVAELLPTIAGTVEEEGEKLAKYSDEEKKQMVASFVREGMEIKKYFIDKPVKKPADKPKEPPKVSQLDADPVEFDEHAPVLFVGILD